MDKIMYSKHYDAIKGLIKNLGLDAADDYLQNELSNFTKEVVSARERVYLIKESMILQTNSDEMKHLRYDLDEAKNNLSILLDKLKTSDEMYICYKEYLRNHCS